MQNNQLDDLSQLTACEECDAVYQRVPLDVDERAFCLCCGAEIYRQTKSLSTLLPLVVCALIVFVICNSFPIVKVDLQGNDAQTTLVGAAMTMFQANRELVGVLVLVTTFIVPLMDLLLLLYVLVNITLLKKRPQFLIPALRIIALFRTWGMIEVFLIGVLVTLVKLIAMVVVIPGVALWAFCALSVLLVYISSFKVKDIWNEIDRSVPK